jgi:predicted RNA-binding Zn-ribbon protein involved in translation (DUF1610 family)
MDIGSILIGLALLIAVAFIVAQPLIEPRRRQVAEKGEADRLRQQRDQLLVALRDLDFDHALGKIQTEDYTPLRAELVAEGAAVLKRLDALGQSQPQAGSPDLDAKIEQAIAARRKARPAAAGAVCPSCNASVKADDLFCPRCGAALARRCPKCGTVAQAGDRFCAKCGAKLPDVSPEVPA